MSFIQSKLVLCFFVLMYVTQSQSEENDQATPEIVVTGTIIQDDSIFESLPKYSLDATEIAALYPSTVADLLRGISGVSVTQEGGSGGLTFVSIRGGDPNFTVVMIDGIKVDDPTNSRGGGYDFSGLDPLMIDRIDVFFGSYSSVYGSDALSGAISVATRGISKSLSGSGTIELGSSNSWAIAANMAGPISESISAGISAVHRKGNNSVDGDSMERQQFGLKFSNITSTALDSNWALNFFYSNANASSFPISSGGDQLSVIRDPEKRKFEQFVTSARYEWTPILDWQASLVAGWTSYKEENDSPGIASGVLSGTPAVLTHSQYERGNVVFNNTLRVNDRLRFGFGAEAIHENGQIDSLINFGFLLPSDFSVQRDTLALFGETAFSLAKPLTIIASLRHDEVERISSSNGRVIVNYDIERTGTSASFIYAEGYKLPSMFALGHSLTGNPNLLPERSESISFELGQSFFEQRLHTTISVYHNEFKDIVDFDFTTFSHVNRNSATTKGIDLMFKAEASEQLWVSGSIGYLHTDVSDDTRLELRPRWSGGLRFEWKPKEKWSISMSANIKGSYYDTSIPTGEVLLDGYTHIDSRVQWSISEKISLRFLLNNLLNSQYEEKVGFSTPGREARLALTVRF